jgi:hypothetical protein
MITGWAHRTLYSTAPGAEMPITRPAARFAERAIGAVFRLTPGVTVSAPHAIDTDRYDLADPAVVARARDELRATGCCVLPDFVRRELRATLRAEGASVAPLAYYDVETVNVYNTEPDPSLPADHPARVPMRRGNAFVARDLIPSDAVISRLYSDRGFQRFVAACFGLDGVHELADPLSGLTLNVVTPGRAHPWHFDTNEFTVSMLTQEPDGGGVFEYCPNIRSARAENLDDVRAVLEGSLAGRGIGADGRREPRRLALRPGDLQLFLGRYSLHRVGTVEGATARHSAIFAYSERPGVIGSAERTRQLFGRVAPEHLAARTVRVDRLMD